MASQKTGFWGTIKSAFHGFSDDDCTSLAGALAYFTIFALPPLLLIVIAILGMILGQQAAQGQVVGQLQQYVGAQGASAIQIMIAQAGKSQTGSIVATIVGVVGLLFGASGAFLQLQKALNKTWGVEPDPDQGGVKAFILKRLLSFGMILLIALLVMASLIVSTVVSAIGGTAQDWLPSAFSGPLLQLASFLVSFLIIMLLFALLFKFLPDASIRWKDVWVGAAFTALLFEIGKFLIGLYLGKSSTAGTYGAAGSLVVLLLWIYYASLILLFGAEFTQAWAHAKGSEIQPKKGAIRIVKEKKKRRG